MVVVECSASKGCNRIRAGEYELVAGMTQLQFLQMLLEGRVIEYQIRIGEGWTLREAIKALQAHDAGLPVFLGNPKWAATELAEAARQIPRGTIVKGSALEARGLPLADAIRQVAGLAEGAG